MKKIHTVSLIASLVLGLAFCFTIPVTSEATTNGGAVQTNGVIGFYEEETSDSTSSSSSDSATSESSLPSESTTSQSKLPSDGGTNKPTGSYPSTGELVKNSLTISGAALIVIAAAFLFWKRKQEKEAQGKGK
ncbi:LPXTG cell wall anchor domain-containing protein [uncultured Enterococcus sp.]|uniref:LPXTG cell wall anchor domain-containing protein n=1 Tax=uncultured Enterococcus sp. TaxID=167972 RepID=UPI002AA86677|nr:LPXTG cell wall anchor domain-containing protein [uncultured Enterococcus sp.]